MAVARTKPAKPRRRRPVAVANKSAAKEESADERPLKIGEAARLIEVEAYVLRFWETQFPFLRPRHANSSHRMYRPADLEVLRLVKRLLHIEGYTIAGAKKHIRENGLERLCAGSAKSAGLDKSAATDNTLPEQQNRSRDPRVQRLIGEIRADLTALRKLLDD